MESKDKTTSCIEVTFEGAIAHLKLNRPDKHNSMTPEFWRELPAAIDKIEAHAATRVAVLSAAGVTFSSGMDLSVFQKKENLSTDTAVERERLRRLVLHLQSVFNRIENCRVPVIAVIQGGCIGAGFDLVCACDLRYGTSAAYFTIAEINLGMMADLGTLQRLPKLIGPGVAAELALTGDKLSAADAAKLGLLNGVFDDEKKLLEHALKVAAKIAERSPVAISATRQALAYARSHSTEDALAMAAVLQSSIFSSADVLAAVTAQKDRTAAKFADLSAGEIKL